METGKFTIFRMGQQVGDPGRTKIAIQVPRPSEDRFHFYFREVSFPVLFLLLDEAHSILWKIICFTQIPLICQSHPKTPSQTYPECLTAYVAQTDTKLTTTRPLLVYLTYIHTNIHKKRGTAHDTDSSWFHN
jgi:hypothetical protein